MAASHLHLTHTSPNNLRYALYTLSTRHFAKRGIYRGRRRKLRQSKPGLPRGDKPRIDDSPTRTLTASPWGPPRYPVPRVQESSVEFAQNLNSLCRIVQSKIQCLGLAVASYDHSAKVPFFAILHSPNQIQTEIHIPFSKLFKNRFSSKIIFQ